MPLRSRLPLAARIHAPWKRTLQTFYPNQLIQPPPHARLPGRELRCGDTVTLHPDNGQGPVTSVVQAVVPLFGCVTYTSETQECAGRSGRNSRLRFRFRLKDVHETVPAPRHSREATFLRA